MKIMTKKAIAVFSVMAIFMTFIVAGCGDDNAMPYHSEIYDNAVEWVDSDFAKNNLIRNVYYYNDETGETMNTNDDSYPLLRTFTIKSSDECYKVFVENTENINADFDKQILIVYTFRDINHRKLELIAIELKNDILQIELKSESRHGVGDTSMPYQRWIVVKLDRLDFSSVEFTQK